MENQFNAGDLVWAKVPHHPWWPSLICHEALASTQAQQAKKEGCVLVSFFGDNSYKWLDRRKLCHFESSYGAYANRFSSRLFVKAVNEAVYEVNHRAALGLTCPCQFISSYRPSPVEGLVEVDVAGYSSGGVYNLEQIQQFRQEFRPLETLVFVQQLALGSADVPQGINYSKEAARVLAFRKAKYAEVDVPYFLAFGVDPRRPGHPVVASNNQEITLIQAPTGHPSEPQSKGEDKPIIKCSKKSKRCLQTRKDKVHAKNAKSSVKRYRHHESNNKISQQHVPEKQRCVDFDVERNLDLTLVANNEREVSAAPTASEPENQRQEKPTIKCQNKSKRRVANLEDKLEAIKAKSSVKRCRHHDSNDKVSQDHLPIKKRLVEFELKGKKKASRVNPTGHPFAPETQVQEKPTIKCQNKRKTSQKDKPHAIKAKSSVKRYRHHDSNNKTSQDQVREKIERKLDFTSTDDNEKESFPSPFKNQSKSKDHKKVKASATTSTGDDVHFVEKFESSSTFVPYKTHCTHKDSPPSSKRLKKGQHSVSLVEGQKMPLTAIKAREKGPRMILSMKFPRDTALPSVSELKAKFAIFGPVDTSAIRVNWPKSRCRVLFMNKSDAEKAYEHALESKKMFGQTKVSYKLRHEISTSKSLQDSNNTQKEETPVMPPHASVRRSERLYEEIYTKYEEEVDQTRVKVNQGGVDISEKMLYLLNQCNRIVQELKRS